MQPLMSKCVVLTSHGGYDRLRVESRAATDPGPDDVRIRVEACGLNFADMYVRQGLFHTQTPPFVMGREAAGIVDKVGPEVTEFQVGDRVACCSEALGLWSEIACVPANRCWALPDAMSFEDGAAFFVNYLTAYFAVFDFGNLRPGQKIFIHSVAGGVGWAATQLAKTVVNTTVIGTAADAKACTVQQNGVDHVIDSYETNYVDRVLQMYPEGVDIVLDNRSGYDFGQGQKLLGPMGRIVHLGINSAVCGEHRSLIRLLRLWWQTKHIPMTDLIANNRAVCGFHLDVLRQRSPARVKAAFDAATKLYLEGRLKPKIDSLWSFEQVVAATAHFESRRSVGKVILKPNNDVTLTNEPTRKDSA